MFHKPVMSRGKLLVQMAIGRSKRVKSTAVTIQGSTSSEINQDDGIFEQATKKVQDAAKQQKSDSQLMELEESDHSSHEELPHSFNLDTRSTISPGKGRCVTEFIGDAPENLDFSCSSEAFNQDVEIREISQTNNIKKRKIETDSVETVSIKEKRPRKDGCKSTYDKINFCTFCLKGFSKLSRHILNVHKNETRVIEILMLPKKSKQRHQKLQLITNEGNFKHNSYVLSSGNGQLNVARRPPETHNLNINDFLPCDVCHKFIKKNNLWHHRRNCILNPSGISTYQGDNNNAIRRGKSLLFSSSQKSENNNLDNLFSRMKDDNIKLAVFEDEIILKYCSMKLEALGDESVQKTNDIYRVSQGARSLARLLIEVKKDNLNIRSVCHMLKPEHFDAVVEGAKNMAFKSESKPLSLTRLLGNLISHAIQIKAGLGVRENSDEKTKQAQNFQKLFDSEWNYRVNAIAQKEIDHMKRKNIKTVPLTNDLKMLLSYMKQKMAEKMRELEIDPKTKDWSELASLTLCRLIIFNKRRRAEVVDLKLEDYNERPDWRQEGSEEIENSLSSTAKIVYQRFVKIYF